MSISKCFDEGSEKRNVSGDTDLEEKAGKIKEKSSESYTDKDNTFEQGLESPAHKQIQWNLSLAEILYRGHLCILDTFSQERIDSY